MASQRASQSVRNSRFGANMDQKMAQSQIEDSGRENAARENSTPENTTPENSTPENTGSKLELTPSVILVRPQLPENIGMCARAMANHAIGDLCLVAPRPSWRTEKTYAAASGADWIVDKARVFADLRAAAAEFSHLFGTTRRARDLPHQWVSPRQAAQTLTELAPHTRVGWVFGPERDGLNNDDLTFCHRLISIPVSPELPSLNLAQAVYAVTHQYYLCQQSQQSQQSYQTDPSGPAEPWATSGEMDRFLDDVFAELDQRRFFVPAHRSANYRRLISRIFRRMHLTQRELQTLYGVFKALARPPKIDD